jgi:hypothetical protein
MGVIAEASPSAGRDTAVTVAILVGSTGESM